MNTSDEKETHLNQDVTFKGTVNFSNSMRVDGTIEGKINSDGTLNVTKTGQVKAEIKVKDIESEGLINGNINAKGIVKLNSSAKMFGNLKANLLKIDEGVVFEGKCDVNPSKEEIKK